MNFEEKNNFLSAKEVSRALSIPLRTVQRLSKQGKIRAIRIGNKWKYHREDVERYLSFGTDFSREPAREPDSFNERRAYPRINSNFECRYSINLEPIKKIEGKGIIQNMSAGGVLLHSRYDAEKTKIDDPINLEFSIPSSNADFPMRAEGRIVRKDGDFVGIKFRRILEGDKNRIIQYVG